MDGFVLALLHCYRSEVYRISPRMPVLARAEAIKHSTLLDNSQNVMVEWGLIRVEAECSLQKKKKKKLWKQRTNNRMKTGDSVL